MDKWISYAAGLASLAVAYYALKDRGWFGDQAGSGPIMDSNIPDTDPQPSVDWQDQNPDQAWWSIL